MSPDTFFIDYSIRKLDQLRARIHDCLGRLSDEQVWMRGGESQNAVGNLVLHLCGNVRQWIGSAVGGKPDVRARDREFSARGDIAVSELRERLDVTVDGAIEVLRSLTAEQLAERVSVQNYEVTALEAVYHSILHFAEHTGQIIFATKALTREDLGYYKHLTGMHTEQTP